MRWVVALVVVGGLWVWSILAVAAESDRRADGWVE